MVSFFRYLEVISGLAPDYYAALSDEVPSVKTSHRRAALSVDRTLCWLDQCLAAKVLPAVPSTGDSFPNPLSKKACSSDS